MSEPQEPQVPDLDISEITFFPSLPDSEQGASAHEEETSSQSSSSDDEVPEGPSDPPLKEAPIEASDDSDDSDVDPEWLDSISDYYLRDDEVETSWPEPPSRLASLVGRAMDIGSQPSEAPRTPDDGSYVVVPRNPERQQLREDQEEEERQQREPSFGWEIPFGPLQQEDYTWEQRHPTRARFLSYFQGAREATAAITQHAQPYIGTAQEAYNNAATRVNSTARVAGEVAIVTGQVSMWLAGEALQAAEEMAPVVQAYVQPIAENLGQQVRAQVAEGGRLARGLFREYMLAVVPLERYGQIARPQRRR